MLCSSLTKSSTLDAPPSKGTSCRNCLTLDINLFRPHQAPILPPRLRNLSIMARSPGLLFCCLAYLQDLFFEGRSALDLKDSSWKQRALLLLWRSATSTGPSLEGKDSVASLSAQGLAQNVLRANVCDNSLFWEKSHFDGCLRNEVHSLCISEILSVPVWKL